MTRLFDLAPRRLGVCQFNLGQAVPGLLSVCIGSCTISVVVVLVLGEAVLVIVIGRRSRLRVRALSRGLSTITKPESS